MTSKQIIGLTILAGLILGSIGLVFLPRAQKSFWMKVGIALYAFIGFCIGYQLSEGALMQGGIGLAIGIVVFFIVRGWDDMSPSNEVSSNPSSQISSNAININGLRDVASDVKQCERFFYQKGHNVNAYYQAYKGDKATILALYDLSLCVKTIAENHLNMVDQINKSLEKSFSTTRSEVTTLLNQIESLKTRLSDIETQLNPPQEDAIENIQANQSIQSETNTNGKDISSYPS